MGKYGDDYLDMKIHLMMTTFFPFTFHWFSASNKTQLEKKYIYQHDSTLAKEMNCSTTLGL